jgi:hypothetical protein
LREGGEGRRQIKDQAQRRGRRRGFIDTKQRLNVGWSRYFVSMAVFSTECVLYRMCLQNLFSMEYYNICSLGPLQTQPRDGQTSPHRPRLVGSRSTCPPLSPFPDANSFVIGTAAINTHIPPARAALLPRHALTYRVTQTKRMELLRCLRGSSGARLQLRPKWSE